MNKSMRNLLAVLKASSDNLYKIYEIEKEEGKTLRADKTFKEWMGMISAMDLIKNRKLLKDTAEIYGVELE